MKEKMMQFKDTAKSFWFKRSKSQKGIFIGSFAIVVALIIGVFLVTSNSNLVPLYRDLSAQEAGQVTSELDSRGVTYELEDGGTTITVPEDQVDTLLVDLAGEDIPSGGSIDYSFFSENASWGTTDNEFDMIKLDAMQTELANLMKGIDGIEDAKVMINLPEDPVFVSDDKGEASASVVINTQPGQNFEGNQIETLYHLVSGAVPNLPEENIVIMNQYFEYYDQADQEATGDQDTYTYQQSVKKDIERDVQQRVQQMLGAMVGAENVIVSVTADVDFTKESREEEIVEPVDVENMEGVPVSIETVRETYDGGSPPGGVEGTGEGDVPGYEGEDSEDDGDYEHVKETINNEYNRIHKDIAESPYKLRDLGVQVAVDRVKSTDRKEPQYLSQQEERTVEDGISSILDSIVSTSIDKEYDDVDLEDNISIVFQEFSGDATINDDDQPAGVPLWVYLTGGLLLLVILILLFILFRNRNAKEDAVEEETMLQQSEVQIPDMEDSPQTESAARRKQLEKMAKERPEEFAKLLRSWISDD